MGGGAPEPGFHLGHRPLTPHVEPPQNIQLCPMSNKTARSLPPPLGVRYMLNPEIHKKPNVDHISVMSSPKLITFTTTKMKN